MGQYIMATLTLAKPRASLGPTTQQRAALQWYKELRTAAGQSVLVQPKRTVLATERRCLLVASMIGGAK